MPRKSGSSLTYLTAFFAARTASAACISDVGPAEPAVGVIESDYVNRRPAVAGPTGTDRRFQPNGGLGL